MIKNISDGIKAYAAAFTKWFAAAVLVGIVGGAVGSIFHICVDYVTELREEYSAILYFLPLGGLAIAFMYRLFASSGRIDTDRVIESVRENESIPPIMIPLIFISTVITHMLGGSAGREGAALQLGGGIGYKLGSLMRLDTSKRRIIVTAGMSSVFSALFGTPVTAAVFASEVTSVGVLNYTGLFPCMLASVTAYLISKGFGIAPVKFSLTEIPALSVLTSVKIVAAAIIFAVISIVFILAIEELEHYSKRLIKNDYLRAFAGGTLIVLLTVLLKTRAYNGAGMDVIKEAIGGQVRPEAFALKIIFTAITIAAGFKGGEIVPSFFIGSTLGCTVAAFLGLDPSFAAAIGFTALFCGVVNCPLASVILSAEVFGSSGILYFSLACIVCYMLSGSFGLYKSQKLVYSKLDAEYININAK